MPAMGAPVVLVPNGTPVTPGTLGTPVTIVGGNAGVITDGSTVNIFGANGTSQRGTATAVVDGGTVKLTLPAGSTIITDQAGGIVVQDADGTQANASAVIASPSNLLSYVGLPGEAALVTNGMSVKMANFGGAGPVDGVVALSGGFINWVSLASQTNAIIADSFSTDISAIVVSPSDDFASVNVSSGALQSVQVSLAPTKAVVEDAQALQVPVTGTYTNTITPTIANGVVTGFTLS